MAINIVIPDELREGLEKLHSLKPKVVSELVKTLKNTEPSLHYTDLVSRVANDVKGCPNSDARDIVFTILGLYSGTTSSKMEVNTFLEDIAHSRDLNIPEDEREAFRKRLNQFLGIEALEITVKALNVFTDHERTFQDVRIITDIRPIFSMDPEKPPRDSVVVHSMKVMYREGSDYKEFFVAMDRSDLNTMKKAIDRALAKEKSSLAALKEAKINILS